MLMWNMPRQVPGLRPRTFSAQDSIMRPFACDGTTTIKSTAPLFGTLEGILFERQLRISYHHTPKTAGAGEKLSAGRPRAAGRSNTREPRENRKPALRERPQRAVPERAPGSWCRDAPARQ